MGDRANVQVKTNGKSVFLYTHWKGEELPKIVQHSLLRKQRWDDAQYLARIIFCEMIGPNELGGETGYGISAEVGDGDNRIVIVDTDEQKVRWHKKAASFDEFVRMTDVSW